MTSATDSGEATAPSRLSVGSILTTAVWLGLFSGIVEALVYGFRKVVLGHFLVMNWHFPWMVPVATGIILLCLGAAAIPFARWKVVPWGRELVLLGLVFVAAFSPLKAVPGLARYAVALLALGVSVQVARLCHWRLDVLARFARRTIAGLAGAVALVMAGMMLWVWIGERVAISRLASADRDAPNVVLIVLDTVRAKSLTPYGYSRQTSPALAQLAAQGVTFDRALATAPWTLPSHASFFTGLYPHEHGADWSKPLDGRHATLAEVLRDKGYLTAGFAANTLNVTRTHGLARGFIHFEDLPVSIGRLALSTSLGTLIAGQGSVRHWLNYHEVADRQHAETITTNCLSWLRAHQGRPFFVFVNYFDTHDPYLPPDPFATKFGPRRNPKTRFWHTGVAAFPVDRERMSPAAKQAEIDAYDGAIAYVDSQVDRLLTFLDAQGQRHRTLVIVTSDHGEQLGEHGLFNHGNSLYRPLTHVPLVMSLPGRLPAGVRVAAPVSLKDLPRTVMDVLGDPEGRPFAGHSLVRSWTGAEGENGDAVLIEATRRPFGNQQWYPLLKGNMTSVVAEGYQYIRNGDDTEELYDFTNDTEERVNLATSPAHAAVLEKLRRLAAGR
jgi:arylsulfatase A-like enzyme